MVNSQEWRRGFLNVRVKSDNLWIFDVTGKAIDIDKGRLESVI